MQPESTLYGLSSEIVVHTTNMERNFIPLQYNYSWVTNICLDGCHWFAESTTSNGRCQILTCQP
jgi:hypothetical protein